MYSDKKPESVFSRRVKAGSKRTYFFDVRINRKGDYFLAITESRKVLGTEDSYEKNKVFLYREDFNKFQKALDESIHHVKTELMPDFDFTAFDDEKRRPSLEETSLKDENTSFASDTIAPLEVSSSPEFQSDKELEEDDKL